MKLLVLGASGFVGSNTLGPLADLGCQLYAVQRRIHLRPEDLKNEVRWVGQAELLSGSPEIIPDAILSLAGVGEPAAFEKDPDGALAGELAIADSLAALVCKFRVPRVIYLSSGGAVYGEGWNDGEFRAFQEDEICHPISTYGKCKLAGEERLVQQLEAAGLLDSLAILRASNVYGLNYAKSGRQGLINALIERSLDGRPVTVYGDGLVYRDYLFADDLAIAIRRVLQTSTPGIFNIAAGRSHSILEVIECVERTIGSRLERRFEPPRGIDIRYSALSVHKAASVLGWQSSISLETGISLIVQRKTEDLRNAVVDGNRCKLPADLPESANVK